MSSPRHLRDAEPRFALVAWPDGTDRELPCCIELSGIREALNYGAIIIGKEDEEFCKPRAPQRVEPALLRLMRRHPYRFNAEWRSGEGKD